MSKKFIVGGCSFTFGHELKDDDEGKTPSRNTWAHGLYRHYCAGDLKKKNTKYVCTASGGAGNSAIARRVFSAVSAVEKKEDIEFVVIMWTFPSRYDWAMPRHRLLEKTRWASITPWDTNAGNEEAFRTMSNSQAHQEQWRARAENMLETGIKPFAEGLYKHAANLYHEIYLSWKSIIWLQNILKKYRIPYMFTLADNTLFYNEFTQHKDLDSLMQALYNEIYITKWFTFGKRMMGFNQWALMEDYERGVTHPLDKAHRDAVQLMLPTFDKLIGEK